MSKPLKERINARLAELGLTARKASLSVSNNPDLIRTLLREDGTSHPRADTLAKVALALQVPADWLLDGETATASDIPASAKHQQRPSTRIAARHPLPDVPVMGTAHGSIVSSGVEGTIIDGPIDYVRRPPALEQAKDIYAIYVSGDSMAPAHNPGDLRFVHPHKACRPGDTVIVQTRAHAGDPGQAYIKRLTKRLPGKILLEQLNPPASLEIPTDFISRMHRVLTTNELFGA